MDHVITCPALLLGVSQVVTLTSENTELEARMSPVQSELVSLRIRLSEAEKVTV